MKSKILGLMAVGLLAGPMAANAALTTYDWTINASNFTSANVGFPAAPQDPATALMSFVADPTLGSNSGTVSSLSLVIGSTTYTTAGFVTGVSAVFGSNCNSFGCSVSIFSPGFVFSIANWATAPVFNSFDYSVGNGTIYKSRTGSRTNRVPEPGTLALLGLGLAGLGLSRRRKAN